MSFSNLSDYQKTPSPNKNQIEQNFDKIDYKNENSYMLYKENKYPNNLVTFKNNPVFYHDTTEKIKMEVPEKICEKEFNNQINDDNNNNYDIKRNYLKSKSYEKRIDVNRINFNDEKKKINDILKLVIEKEQLKKKFDIEQKELILNSVYMNEEEKGELIKIIDETSENINEIETILNKQKIKDEERIKREEKILNERLNKITSVLNESIEIGRILAKEQIKTIEDDLAKKIEINESIKNKEFEKLENELSNKKKEIDLKTEEKIQKLTKKVEDALLNINRYE